LINCEQSFSLTGLTEAYLDLYSYTIAVFQIHLFAKDFQEFLP